MDARNTDRTSRRTELAKRLALVERELENLADTAARGGAVPAIIQALDTKDAQRRSLVRQMDDLQQDVTADAPMDPRELRAELRSFLDDWQGTTQDNAGATRKLLETVLRERITCKPMIGADGALFYELLIPLQFDRLLVMAVPMLRRVGLASPTGFDPFLLTGTALRRIA